MMETVERGRMTERGIFNGAVWTMIAALVTASVIAGLRRTLWLDEIYTLRVLDAGDLPHILQAIWQGADTQPPLYFIAAFGVRKMFPGSVGALRIFSSLCTIGGIILLSRFFRHKILPPAIPVTLLFFVVSPLFGAFLISELRSYALYFFFAVIFLISYDRMVSARGSRVLNEGMVLLSATALLYTHYFGIVHYIAFFTLTVALEKRYPTSRETILLLVPIVLFLPWIPAVFRQLAQVHYLTWQTKPSAVDVLQMVRFSFGAAGWILFCVLIIANGLSHGFSGVRMWYVTRPKTAILLAAFLVCPVLLFLLAVFGIGIWNEKYIQPAYGAAVVLLGIQVQSLVRSPGFLQVVIVAGLCALGGERLAGRVREMDVDRRKMEAQVRLVSPGVPVVCESPHTFYPLAYYARLAGRPDVYLVRDWESAAAGGSVKDATFDFFQVQTALFRDSCIISYDELKRRFPKFYLIQEEGRMFFDYRIKTNASYVITQVNDAVLEVQKRYARR